MTQFDLATLFDAVAATVPDRVALVWREQRRTFAEEADRIGRLAAVLAAHGLGRRAEAAEPWESNHDHLALHLHNGPEYLEGLVGAHRAGVAPFNVNYRYVDDELAYLFADAGPAAILYHEAFAPLLARVLPALGRPPLLLQVADGSGHALLPGALDYESALAAAEPGPFEASPDDLHILYTGGTTGMPKGVLWRIGDLVEGPLGVARRDGRPYADLAEALANVHRVDARTLVLPPMMHGSGTWTSLGGWLGGATVVLPDRVDGLDPAGVWKIVERERVTRIPLVGDAFARPLVEELERGAYDTSSLRHLLNSGAAINPATRRRIGELLPAVRLIDVVGSSESGFQITRMGNDPFRASAGAGVLSADRTRLLEPGEPAVGEEELGWLVKSGLIPRGYLGDPDKTRGTFVTFGGRSYVIPGDRAKLLADGTVEMHGRDSMTINTGGEKVFAEEVEAVVRALPQVAEALVVGRASERWGTEIVAVVRPAPGSEEVPDEVLKTACAEHLARYKIPKAFVRTDAGLRLPNGKADYATARRLVAPSQEPT
ncbi:AMP-binding protein [Actinocorallia longicatena]|uniref:Acyl-CoA synthetase n=1 Tax=Actinocorallia longicatena TaxID=111803 RepID=A0ABP6PZB1_9ACTN